MPTSHIDDLLTRNAAYADTAHRARALRPDTSTIVVSCMDSRADPAHVLGLRGGEAMVLRRAGARVTPELEVELAMLVAILRQANPDAKPRIMLMQHTDCGAQKLADPAARARYSELLQVPVETVVAMAIHDHDTSLRDDIARLQRSERVPSGLSVIGVCYDCETGRADVRVTGTT